MARQHGLNVADQHAYKEGFSAGEFVAVMNELVKHKQIQADARIIPHFENPISPGITQIIVSKFRSEGPDANIVYFGDDALNPDDKILNLQCGSLVLSLQEDELKMRVYAGTGPQRFIYTDSLKDLARGLNEHVKVALNIQLG
jgi:hypothetical protein